MAGRGTDIKIDDRVRNLTGVVKIDGAIGPQEYPLGGLYVIGTEKHETRRIDNQLRGRSGRQGDPGLSQFMLSPQDEIMRVFGGNKLFALLASFESHPEGDPLIESKALQKNITTIQKQVEGRNFDIRKHILEYDDVLNHHRLAIYSRRNKILEGGDVHAEVIEMLKNEIHRITELVRGDQEEFDSATLGELVRELNEFAESEVIKLDQLSGTETILALEDRILSIFSGKIESLRDTGTEAEFAEFERRLMLASIDELWMNHIDSMAHLREEVAFE